MMEGLTLTDVKIHLDGTLLLAINTHVKPGETLTVMGPSGVGKSSLLSFIGGFLAPDFMVEGQVWLQGEDVTPLPAYRRRTGLLFQDPLLFPHMSVGENLLFALPSGGAKRERREQAEQALESVELDGFFNRDTATLSGGQKARVALVRVLLSRPRALLLDEPFSKLDTTLRGQTRELVFSEAARQNLPTVLVTHDQADADAAGGQLVRLG